MRKVFIIVLMIMALNFVVLGDDEGFKKQEKIQVKVYYNLANLEVLSYEGQLEFLDSSAKEVMPVNKWGVPQAVVTHKLYSNTNTAEIIFTASSTKTEKSVDFEALVRLTKATLKKWCSQIQIIAESKEQSAMKNLEKALKYQKEQHQLKIRTAELETKMTHAKSKLADSEKSLNTLYDEIAKTKSTIKELREKIEEVEDASQMKLFLEQAELKLIEDLESLEEIKTKVYQFKEVISGINDELEELSVYNPLSAEYLSKLAEKTMLMNKTPEMINKLGNADNLE